MPLRRIVVIANPRAGLRVGGALTQAVELLKKHIETRVEPTQHAGHAEQLARELGSDPDTLVAVCGGDGTLYEALNGIPSQGVLGLLPAGTANVVARELGIPLDLREAAKVLLTGAVRSLDVGVCNGRRFLMVAGFGYDAHVAARVPSSVKRVLGKYAYHLQAAYEYLTYKPPCLQISMDGGEWLDGKFALIANLRRYGGDLFFAQDARPDDGLLNLVLFRDFSPRSIVRGVGGAWLRRGVPEQVAERRTGRVLRLRSDSAVPHQLDGEVLPEIREAEIHVLSAALKMVAP